MNPPLDDDSYLMERFRAKRPFEGDSMGLRGHQPVARPEREFLGQIGGNRSWQTASLPVPPDPIQTPQAAGNTNGSGAVIKDVIIVFNGTAEYCALSGVITGPV